MDRFHDHPADNDQPSFIDRDDGGAERAPVGWDPAPGARVKLIAGTYVATAALFAFLTYLLLPGHAMEQPWTAMLCLGAGLVVAGGLIQRRPLRGRPLRDGDRLVFWLCWLLGTLALAVALAHAGNRVFDRSRGEKRDGVVVSRSGGKTPRIRYRIHHDATGRTYGVGSHYYPGTQLRLSIRRGSLGASWLESIRSNDPPEKLTPAIPETGDPSRATSRPSPDPNAPQDDSPALAAPSPDSSALQGLFD